MQINFAYRPWVGPSAVTTLHISWPIHHDDGHFPTIRLRQSTHLTKCPAHSHINFCSDKSTQIQRCNKSDIQTCNYCDGQTSFEMLLKTQLAFLHTWFECKFRSEHAANSISQYFRLFSHPLWIPHTMPKLQKEQLHKRVVLKSVDAFNRKLVTQGERVS